MALPVSQDRHIKHAVATATMCMGGEWPNGETSYQNIPFPRKRKKAGHDVRLFRLCTSVFLCGTKQNRRKMHIFVYTTTS